MFTVIDTATPTTPIVNSLTRAGIRTVIRYYNHRDMNQAGKRISRTEAEALESVGISIAAIFQQRAGAGEPRGHIEDLTAVTGRRDATRAMQLSRETGQPKGSAIYFSVDWDFIRASDLAAITAYFESVRATLGKEYRSGVRGSGLICEMLLRKGLVDLTWLAQHSEWTGHDAFLKSQKWALVQGPVAKWPDSSVTYDPNYTNPAFADFGQFTLGQPDLTASNTLPAQPPRSILKVTARGGLSLRRGPGTGYPQIRTLPLDSLVFGIARQDEWIQLDIRGDGRADGYAHGGYLELAAGGFPLTYPLGATPYDIARVELAENIRRYPANIANPRVFLYNASTGHGDADEVPWCSSFVNFCVESAGMIGTDSKSARSWHDQDWGHDASDDPREGDIAVWQRRWTDRRGVTHGGGHVGFVVSSTRDSVTVLGGNLFNRISIATYPRDGMLGGQSYHLLSVRSAAELAAWSCSAATNSLRQQA